MTERRVLLMHVTASSGHHQASRAIAHTLRQLSPPVSVVDVDAFKYVSGFVRWAIAHTYASLIRHQPDIWEYLYDNPTVHQRVQSLQQLIHRYHSTKLAHLLADVRPHVVACTQAFPCGMVADFKKRYGLRIPLVGILTDYAPHLYWFHECVDVYVVPSEEVRRRFLLRGIHPSKVRVLGIPIDRRFQERHARQDVARRFGLDPAKPMILIMGGSSGHGQLREIIASLDALPHPCEFVVLAGTNHRLLAWLRRQRFRHPVASFGYLDDVSPLMDYALLLISKPGGLTMSEALAKQLPIVMVNPIPGQEAYNARLLLTYGAAVQVGATKTVRQIVRDFLDNPDRLEGLRLRAAHLGRPDAAERIARLLTELGERTTAPLAASVAGTGAMSQSEPQLLVQAARAAAPSQSTAAKG